MRSAIGARTVGVWTALAATVIVAACNSDGGSTASPSARGGTTTRSPGTARSPAPAGVTNATISWAAPTENTNGSAVGALGGYKIYYGTTSGHYTAAIDVSNPGLTTYVVDNLKIGATYYFAVAAFSAAGVEGALSPEVAAQIS
jgi:PKD repeat protein